MGVGHENGGTTKLGPSAKTWHPKRSAGSASAWIHCTVTALHCTIITHKPLTLADSSVQQPGGRYHGSRPSVGRCHGNHAFPALIANTRRIMASQIVTQHLRIPYRNITTHQSAVTTKQHTAPLYSFIARDTALARSDAPGIDSQGRRQGYCAAAPAVSCAER